jgi:hypothetical protein
VRRILRFLVILLPGMGAAGCDVEWGGAEFRLENPAPEAPPEPVTEAEAAAPPTPLPEGRLFFAVRIDPTTGDSRAVPIAGLDAEGLRPIAVPEDPDESWRDRFSARFLSAGRELELHAAGRRIGSFVLDGEVTTPRPECMSVATGRSLVPAGSPAPRVAFAFEPDSVAADPERYVAIEADNRMRTFGPILAEQLLRARGENRPYLAQRVALDAVAWPGDANPAFAATYLINDDLEGPAPTGDAVSLFYLARFDPQRGYYPVWSEFRRYEGGAEKEVYTYVDAVNGPSGRVDFVDLRDGSGGRRLAASLATDNDREVDWTESSDCRVETLLGP